MRRLGFAFWLPLLHCALYIALVSTPRLASTSPVPLSGEPETLVLTVAYQEGIPFVPTRSEDGLVPSLARLAFVINLPATAAIAFVLWLVPAVNLDQAALYSAIGGLVPILWWLVGAWVDGELGLRDRRPPRDGKVWNASRQMFLGASILGAFACGGLLIMLLVSRGLRAEWGAAGASKPVLLALLAGLVLWPSFFLSVAWKLIYRARAYRIALLLAGLENEPAPTSPGIQQGRGK